MNELGHRTKAFCTSKLKTLFIFKNYLHFKTYFKKYLKYAQSWQAILGAVYLMD